MLTACGEEQQALPAAPPATVTVQAPPPSVVATPGPEPSIAEQEPSAPPEPTQDQQQVAEGTIPDVIGMDHQLAQDTMQAAGFYNLSEEDASGEGRLLLVDRNWRVVEQEPAAGAQASQDATIILRSEKIDD